MVASAPNLHNPPPPPPPFGSGAQQSDVVGGNALAPIPASVPPRKSLSQLQQLDPVSETFSLSVQTVNFPSGEQLLQRTAVQAPQGTPPALPPMPRIPSVRS
ncbi:MAG TPA: hypothetical protein V6D20_15260, partial [Candidatus Obscuribacterales bacterium]